MKKLSVDNLIADVLKNDRVASRVKELNLSHEQLIEALPILLDMYHQDEINDVNALYLTSFYLTENGNVKRMEILSPQGTTKAFLKNIKTQEIFKISFDDNKDFKKTANRQEIMQAIAYFFKNFPKNKHGFYLYGDHGVGKTFILKRIAKKIAEQNCQVGFVLLPELVNYVKKTFNNGEEYENLKSLLKNVEYLFIDDIGSESISYWFRDEFLWLILNERVEKSKITFFAANYTFENLIKIEAKTQNQKYQDLEKAKRLVAKIKILATPIQVKF